MNTILCNVSGMENKDSKTRIKNELGRIKGVNEVGVNLTTGSVKIEYSDPATETQIKDRIEKSGYKIVYE